MKTNLFLLICCIFIINNNYAQKAFKYDKKNQEIGIHFGTVNYVGDLAQIITSLMDKKTPSLMYNIASGVETSVNEIVAAFIKVSQTSVKPTYKDAIKGEVRQCVLDISLAQKEIGWKQTTPIEVGIEKTWEWAKKNLN